MKLEFHPPESTLGKVLFAPFALVMLTTIFAALMVCVPIYVAYMCVTFIIAIPVGLWKTYVNDEYH